MGGTLLPVERKSAEGVNHGWAGEGFESGILPVIGECCTNVTGGPLTGLGTGL